MVIETGRSFLPRPRLAFRWIALGFLLAAYAVSLNAANPNRVFLHPKVKAREKIPKSLVLLPATAQSATGAKIRMEKVEEAEDLGREVGALVADAFSRNGWQVDRDAFAGTSAAQDAKVRNVVAFLRERHVQMVREMSSRPKDVTKGKFTFGPDVAALGARPKADALLLVHANSVKLPKFAAAILVTGSFGTLLPLVNRPWTSAAATLVDAETGDVLCFVILNLLDRRDATLAKILLKIPH